MGITGPGLAPHLRPAQENVAQLPPTVRELVEKLTKPAPPAECDVAPQLKTQVSPAPQRPLSQEADLAAED